MARGADEFIRRFLLHTLPDGFHRIRHYGFLANGHRAAKLALCRELLAAPSTIELSTPTEPKQATIAFDRCPRCGGAMVTFAILLRPSPRRPSRTPHEPPASLPLRLSCTDAAVCRHPSSCPTVFPPAPGPARPPSKARFSSLPPPTARHRRPRPLGVDPHAEPAEIRPRPPHAATIPIARPPSAGSLNPASMRSRPRDARHLVARPHRSLQIPKGAAM